MLYLASQSRIRHQLLQEAQIPFIVIDHNADERSISWTGPIEAVATAISQLKMASIQLDSNKFPHEVILLTADTLTADLEGNLYGKPADLQEAIEMVKQLRKGSVVSTAFCLQKRSFKNGIWDIAAQYCQAVTARCEFILQDHEVMDYFSKQPSALQAAGALTIEGYGNQFLKSVNGSYSTILGLPMFELQQALNKFNGNNL
jgi:septum formation protein